jgi:hypothetical protein
VWNIIIYPTVCVAHVVLCSRIGIYACAYNPQKRVLHVCVISNFFTVITSENLLSVTIIFILCDITTAKRISDDRPKPFLALVLCQKVTRVKAHLRYFLLLMTIDT